MVIEFVPSESCPHAPILRQRLGEAIRELGMTDTPLVVDLERLYQANDPHSGFGSPTILVDGLDLFGMETPTTPQDPACRLYRPALASTADIIERLSERISPPR